MNKKSHTSIFLFFLFFSLFSQTSHAYKLDENLIDVSATIKRDDQIHILEFSLTNKSEKDLKIYRHSLPWAEGPDRLLLEAVSLNKDFQRLERRWLLENAIGMITLKPKEKITGNVNLNRKFKEFDTALKKSPVVILWIYKPSSPDKTILFNESSGVIFIDQLSPNSSPSN